MIKGTDGVAIAERPLGAGGQREQGAVQRLALPHAQLAPADQRHEERHERRVGVQRLGPAHQPLRQRGDARPQPLAEKARAAPATKLKTLVRRW